MEHITGLSLTTTSEVTSTLVIQHVDQFLVINIFTRTKSGDVKSCTIVLDNAQSIALTEFLQPTEITGFTNE